MPELPEVETIVRQLQKTVQGKIIAEIEILDKKYVNRKINSSPQIPELSSLQNTPSAKIIKITRRAKAILMKLSQGKHLFIRLGMTGYFSHALSEESSKKEYGKVIIHFHDRSSLTFHDIRKFGSFQIFSEQELQQELKKIGPEPLAAHFTPSLLFQLLQNKKNATLKTTLMDQSVLAGIGNIYAQEALYHAKISPQRRAGSVTAEEAKKLHSALQLILQRAIAAGGSTVDNYSSLDGAGSFQQQLVVYQKYFCPKSHPLQRIVLGGRGTWMCEVCQR